MRLRVLFWLGRSGWEKGKSNSKCKGKGKKQRQNAGVLRCAQNDNVRHTTATTKTTGSTKTTETANGNATARATARATATARAGWERLCIPPIAVRLVKSHDI